MYNSATPDLDLGHTWVQSILLHTQRDKLQIARDTRSGCSVHIDMDILMK